MAKFLLHLSYGFLLLSCIESLFSCKQRNASDVKSDSDKSSSQSCRDKYAFAYREQTEKLGGLSEKERALALQMAPMIQSLRERMETCETNLSSEEATVRSQTTDLALSSNVLSLNTQYYVDVSPALRSSLGFQVTEPLASALAMNTIRWFATDNYIHTWKYSDKLIVRTVSYLGADVATIQDGEKYPARFRCLTNSKSYTTSDGRIMNASCLLEVTQYYVNVYAVIPTDWILTDEKSDFSLSRFKDFIELRK